MMIRRLAVFLIAAVSCAAAAQTFPERPVRIIVGYPPGGADISARILGPKLTELWHQPVLIDNRPGAAGNLGAEVVAKAAPDGYTILLCVNSYTINTSIYRNLAWDLLRDFTPIGRYASSPMAVVVNDRVPAKSLAALIAYAKDNPGKLNYGSSGSGTAPHLAAELFAIQTGIQMVHVPYKGSAPSVTAMLSKEVDLSFGALSAFEAVIRDGRLRALAVTTAKRSSQLPEVPTVIENGIAGFDVDIWYGFIAPAKTPPAIVRKMSDDLGRVLADPDTQAKLRQRGLDPAYLNPDQTLALMRHDVARWREVANRVKLSLD
ncbi:MAG: tripartite tricarboxylate transporter substrate binding protein [Betaproteobacteria bacterium]|nr:tripartite tricarboxylate transporter substrate binding protein [Betaproteobacteria bacterium]